MGKTRISFNNQMRKLVLNDEPIQTLIFYYDLIKSKTGNLVEDWPKMFNSVQPELKVSYNTLIYNYEIEMFKKSNAMRSKRYLSNLEEQNES